MIDCQNCPVLNKSIFHSESHNDNRNLTIQKKEKIFKKGQTLNDSRLNLKNIYCIKKGKIKIVKTDVNGHETIVRIANEGDIIGEEFLLDALTYDNAAISLDESEVCYIDKSSFVLALENQNVSLNLFKKTLVTLGKAEEHISSCHLKNVKSRLSELLLEMKNTVGKLENNRYKIELQYNREELAMIIGTAPETIIRAISELKKLGIISGHKLIYINDLTALEKISNNS